MSDARSIFSRHADDEFQRRPLRTERSHHFTPIRRCQAVVHVRFLAQDLIANGVGYRTSRASSADDVEIPSTTATSSTNVSRARWPGVPISNDRRASTS